MSLQSDAAKAHIEGLLKSEYPDRYEDGYFGLIPRQQWCPEYRFAPPRLWRFDYAVPSILCASYGSLHFSNPLDFSPIDAIELDGGTFQSIRSGHSSGVGLRNWREKNNAAMSRGWRVWHYAPEEVIKAGRKGRFAGKYQGCSDIRRLSPCESLRNPAR